MKKCNGRNSKVSASAVAAIYTFLPDLTIKLSESFSTCMHIAYVQKAEQIVHSSKRRPQHSSKCSCSKILTSEGKL